MKISHNFQTAFEATQESELYDRRLDNLVRVESHNDGVVIRTANDNFSEAVKESFVRYLASEGLIPEVRPRGSDDSKQAATHVKWVTDGTWVRSRHQSQHIAARVWAYLTWGRLLSLGLFFVALGIALWFKPR